MENNKHNTRPNWDNYFLEFAKVSSTRSVCFRSHCGAIIVKDKAVVSTGYNSSPKYIQNCEEIGYCYRNKHEIQSGTQLEKCRAVGSHAESNAIALASKLGHSTDKATMYVYGNTMICNQCRGMIANAGIIRVVYMDKNGKIIEIIPEKDWNIHPIDIN